MALGPGPPPTEAEVRWTRLESVCKMAFKLGANRYKPVEHILRLNRDQRSVEAEPEPTPVHENVRRSGFYH